MADETFTAPTTTPAPLATPDSGEHVTQVLGIDIGGSGVKGALVDVTTGELLAERFRIETPQPATPEAVAAVVAEIAAHFNWTGPIGVGFPGVIKNGVVKTAANVHDSWVDVDAAKLIAAATGSPKVCIGNDADVAGLAEITFGAGKDHPGFVIMITLGTGIGSAFFFNGKLLPNMEFGHVEVGGKNAESWASDAAREREDLKWDKWGKRVDRVLHTIEDLVWPDLFIVGGGVSKKSDRFFPQFTLRTPIVTANFLNDAGIVGAALHAK